MIEIIPGANYFCKADYIEIVIENREQLVKDSSPKENVGNALGLLAQPARTHSDVPSDFFCFYGAPCLVILVAMTLAPQSSIFIAFVLRKVFETNRSRNIAVDCFVSFLSWSSTYLFVRRLLNPETTPVVFKKFSADAFYGGLAAASTAFIKPLLTAALQTST